ncbi:sporulation-specific protein 15 [Pyrus ussuriensis x Pyrus communis]|uniref:Sporulation-specific protein 15 n=1 Tax=Pyrus ussuriensis x Pyrus communis TaxID=2448454 RepID=A0A5N5HLI9_9ROSA|nr:sporulation-specific protein 15 [Pyrus ussuriensis x Pyrus communis]
MEIRELRGALASKDNEIKLLKQKLGSPETNPEDSPATVYKFPTQEGTLESPTQVVASPYSTVASPNLDKEMISSYLGEQGTEKFEDSSGNSKVLPRKEEERIMRRRHTVRPHSVSAIEGRFRSDIDELLEENLEFWLRFSTSVHQIQKFHTSIQDLQSELLKLKNKKKHDGHALQSDARPIYRHLREIQTELSLWLEHNAVLKDDLQGRLLSLCHIQDEISRLSSLSSEGENMELISKYQAAKFQGEVLNMKQENNKVADELQAGLNRVDGLKIVSLETAVTSQNALVNKLKSENDELQAHARSLEEEKDTLMENADKMSKRLKELEEELYQNNNLQTHFTKASCNLDHLSRKLKSVKHEEDDENAGLFHDVKAVDAKPEIEIKEDSNKAILDDDSAVLEDKMSEGLEDREKVLLEEYTSILRDYKDARWKLGKVEKKNRDNFFDLAMEIRELRVLKDDLQGMLLSLCHIQDEISRLSSLSSEGENMELISKYQVAKFQGEVLNMKQENNKVADELQVGLNRVDGLKVEVEKTLARLDGELGISVSKSINNPKCSMSKSRIPLRSFLFGVKLRRQRPSIFSCASPSLQKQHSDLEAAAPPLDQPM